MDNSTSSMQPAIAEQIEALNAELNEGQQLAATTTEGPVIVTAGAGAGKTKVLVHRVATLIKKGVAPGNIMVVTFTKKAATEIQERLATMVGDAANHIAAGTFHSIIFQKILKKFPGHRFFDGINIDITQVAIIDESDSKKLFKEALAELSDDDQARIQNENWALKDFTPIISAARAEGYDLGRFKKTFDPTQERSGKKSMAAKVWKNYSALCRKNNCIDFDDILVVCNQFFKECPDSARQMAEEFRYLMLDEYQDTNKVQMNIMDAIAKHHDNIFVVGDEKQSIYGFRGSDINVILGFKKRYIDAVQVEMNINYRSSNEIIGLANGCAEIMKERLGSGQMKRGLTGQTKPHLPVYTSFRSEAEEAESVARSVRRELSKGVKGAEIAILYRKRASREAIERKFLEMEIPYNVVGDTAFFQRAEVKNTLAMLRFLVNPWDTMAGLRLLDAITIGTSGAAARRQVKEQGKSAWGYLSEVSEKTMKAKKKGMVKKTMAAEKAADFIGLATEIKSALRSQNFSSKYKVEVLTKFWDIYLSNSLSKGIPSKDPTEISEEINKRTMNALTLMQHIERELEKGKKIDDVVVDMELLADAKSNDKDMEKRVKLMTAHASKGLEFDSVYLVAADNENMPGEEKAAAAAEGQFAVNVEEERRIFYVATTRAKKRLQISHAQRRLDKGMSITVGPTQYLQETADKCRRTDMRKAQQRGVQR